jgi:hypothetical protein
MSRQKKILFLAAFVAMQAVAASADVVWPSLILEDRLLTWWAILLGLVVEGLVLYRWFKLSPKAAMIADVTMNAVSTLVGYFAIPSAGMAYELGIGRYLYRFGLYTFNPLTWLVTILGAAAINTVIELAVLRIGWKIPYSRPNFGRLLLANIASVAVAFASIAIKPQRL